MPGNQKRIIENLLSGTDATLSFSPSCENRETLEMVARAIRQKQVLLAYQPIMQARDQTCVAMYEGLIRVLDDSGRIIPAGDFMGAVEDHEMGRQLDTLALGLGLRTLHENPDLRLAINMSARSIGYTAWDRTLEQWLSRNELIAERLVLEITESSAITVPERVAGFMHSLQLRGISFAMDDFGAGYTALRYFRDFDFDIVKIDGQFAQGIAQNPDNQVITSALVSIARQFDMLTVAEFVENEEDADMLTSLGVDCLQGYHFGAAITQPHWLAEPRLKKAV
ncbi:EAL domain-containing protein [uncultured Roseobacter sp.]|uniref:EAL domain-containing protein n=1 Tax=uncultured Roseobacter sp. TaxID=114847 RepID=UPI002631A0F2|nr:EAL domain-containing protein [uncultured Roseobacter sp.]